MIRTDSVVSASEPMTRERQTPGARRVFFRAGSAIRDGWLMLGVTALLILVLEGSYRAVSSLAGAISARVRPAPAGPPAPFDASPWAAAYMREHQALDVRWASYVYRRHPAFTGRYINVDSLGHRMTPQPVQGDGDPVRVFFFGGSTLFGWFQRDSFTISAEVARRLDRRPAGAPRAQLTNFAVAGHTFTQGLLELTLQLRNGARPDVVVFYDGINDVMSTVQNKRAGFPQNEWNRENDFMRGRQLADESGPGLANDLRAIRRVAGTAVRRSRLAQRIVAGKSAPAPPRTGIDTLAADLARMYAGNARVIEALGARYGFQPIYVWQPALLSTHKRLTPYETWLLRERPVDVEQLHRLAPGAITAAMAGVAPGRFIDATSAFDDDTLDVYVDLFGHTHERANPRLADLITPTLATAIATSRRKR